MGRDKQAIGLTCVDLWRTFGSKYRIQTDPAYDPAGVRRENLDLWYFTIPCRFGTIWAHGGEMLCVDIDYHGRTARKVGAIPGVRLRFDGSREKTFIFPVALFGKVAKLVKPYRRRQLTPKQRAEAAKLLAPYRFAKA